MKMSKTILIIDGENIAHQSFHKFEKLKSTDGKPSGEIFGFFKSLHMYLTRFGPDEVYITFDNGHSSFRDGLNQNYKGHRKDLSYDRESYSMQKLIILKILGMLRINFIYDKRKSTDYEGDDFLAKITLDKANNKNKVIIISSDKDFNQLLDNPRVKIYNPRKESYVTNQNCKELFGYTPEETVNYLSLVGDTSDDIPGIKGVGPVKARKILDEGFEEYVNSLSDENKAIIDRNRQLIDLRFFINKFPLKEVPIKLYKSKELKLKKFKEICIEYSFNSFMTNEFMKPFNELIK
jgi:DNA polymerase-1